MWCHQSPNNILKIFESNHLTHIQHTSVSITKQLHAAMVSLNEVDALPDETYGNILCGFTKCIIKDFKVVFQHLLTWERFDLFSSCSLITISFHGSSSSELTTDKIKHVLHDANDLHNSF